MDMIFFYMCLLWPIFPIFHLSILFTHPSFSYFDTNTPWYSICLLKQVWGVCKLFVSLTSFHLSFSFLQFTDYCIFNFAGCPQSVHQRERRKLVPHPALGNPKGESGVFFLPTKQPAMPMLSGNGRLSPKDRLNWMIFRVLN